MEEEYLNIGGIYSPRGMRGLTRQDYLDWEIKNAQVLQDNQIPEEQWEDYFVTSKMLKFFPENDKTFWNGYTLDQQVQIYNNRVQELADAFNARTYAPNEVKERDESGQFITEDDFIGVAKSQIADGRIVENMVINLKEVIIADKILCEDVEATVSPNNNAPLLLGGEVLNRVAAYSVDNERKVINFKLR